MKKVLALVLALLMMSAMFLAACKPTDADTDDSGSQGSSSQDSSSEPKPGEGYMVAMVTDYGDITDQSFNQSTYEACKAFCEEYKLGFKYFKPVGNTTADRVSMIEAAIDEGYNVIVMPGYAFAGAIVEAAPNYKDVKFVALDVGLGDLLEAGVTAKGEKYDYDPSNWKLEDYVDMSNVYSAIYQEELPGYMAGYAAVKLGYTKLGFLGGMAVPAVIRYGSGFVQGADAAAKELGITIDMNYVYGGLFQGDPAITAVMDTWYQNGTQVVFACGGGIYTSAADAAKKVGGKLIGVDVDQQGIIDDGYGAGTTVTSAMKGLYPATYDTLTDIIINGNWQKYAGKIETLGLVGEDVEKNYVQLPYESTQWAEGKFTQDDYKALVKKMFDGTIKVSNDTSALPAVTNTKLSDQGRIIG